MIVNMKTLYKSGFPVVTPWQRKEEEIYSYSHRYNRSWSQSVWELKYMCLVWIWFGRNLLLLYVFLPEDDFQQLQQNFLEKYYHEFDDTEENKFVYTDIHKEYVSTLEIDYTLCVTTLQSGSSESQSPSLSY